MSTKASVLVAVENEVSRRILEAQLEGWGYSTRSATSGEQAWEILSNDGDISLLIADRDCRRSDGQDLCRYARSLQRRRYLHIILLVAQGRQETLLDIVDLGADSVLSPPYHPSELLAQIHVAERIITLENRLSDRLEELTAVHKRIREDLRAAAHVQKSLLPEVQPDIPGVRFSWRYEACEQVAGDMFNVLRLDEDRVALYVLDVCGHGVQAAMLTVTLSRLLSPLPQSGGLLKHPIPHPPFYEIVPPCEVARECNRLFPLLGDTNFFFTLLYGILHLKERRFTFVRAGHPGPIHVHKKGIEVLEKNDGIAVGIQPTVEYTEETLPLLPGDKIVMISDGIEEAINPDNEEFGEERFLGILLNHRQTGVEASVDAVWKDLRAFMQDMPRRDDMTILGLEIL